MRSPNTRLFSIVHAPGAVLHVRRLVLPECSVSIVGSASTASDVLPAPKVVVHGHAVRIGKEREHKRRFCVLAILTLVQPTLFHLRGHINRLCRF